MEDLYMRTMFAKTKHLLASLSLGVALAVSGCATDKDSQENNEPTPNGKMKVKIERVVDGDTFKTTRGDKVRLIGVDTPETVKPNTPVQPYGKEASNYSKSMLEGKEVTLQFDVQPFDKYQRLLAYVYLEDGTFYNEHLVHEGYARIMTVPPNVAQAEVFLKAEQDARENNRGLWALDVYQKADQDKKMNTSSKKQKNQSDKKESSSQKESNSEKDSSKQQIKGNINSKGEKIYHVPGGRYYEQTKPEEWFDTEEAAIKAGFRKSKE
ncbi:staphylococcal nuclease homologue family protein [Brevibacillus laterosporus GI-9]|nr:staphylococcal nuclease homologue family protein [Brevibacillus laterosporus GI-9]